ncbi:MAG: sulfite exporter TauE/SafE family protein [Bacteroidales bacterium]|nr:sulfite exporter TauE/SafE family protein [Bacteroidales bacterium]
MTFSVIVILILTGLLAGFAGGVMGIGGALIMIPAMVFLLGMSQHDAQGTSLATMLAPIGILAVLNYYKAGHVNIRYALIIMVAFVIGSWFGSKWAVDIPAKTLKQVFGVLLLLVATKMIFGK